MQRLFEAHHLKGTYKKNLTSSISLRIKFGQLECLFGTRGSFKCYFLTAYLHPRLAGFSSFFSHTFEPLSFAHQTNTPLPTPLALEDKRAKKIKKKKKKISHHIPSLHYRQLWPQNNWFNQFNISLKVCCIFYMNTCPAASLFHRCTVGDVPRNEAVCQQGKREE